jgi:hypothetical protein
MKIPDKLTGRELRVAMLLGYSQICKGEPVFGDKELYRNLTGKIREDFLGMEYLSDVRVLPLDRELPEKTSIALGKYIESCELSAKNVIIRMGDGDVENAESRIYRRFRRTVKLGE